MIECTNCGAVGEANFSTNYFGELVCELCGTQSFLQSRNETQEMEDTTFDMTRVSTLRRTERRKKRQRQHERGKRERKPRSVTLSDCIEASQTILHYQACALVDNCSFPPEYVDVVREIWFHFLVMWEKKSSEPLLRCFTEFYLPRGVEDKQMDPAITSQLLEDWDATIENERREREAKVELEDTLQEADKVVENKVEVDAESATTASKGKGAAARKLQSERTTKRYLSLRAKARTLDHFSVLDLLGILVLAGRVLSLAVLPCDYALWISNGDLPFHNLLFVCSPELQEAVSDVALFFESGISGNKVSAARIAYKAQHLQYHLELSLPPLNASLVAFHICENLGLPPLVHRNFQWIVGAYNTNSAMPEKPLLRGVYDAKHAVESASEIVATLAVAIKMCPNWFEWIYERAKGSRAPPPYSREDVERLPRRDLDAFIDFCEETLVSEDRSSIPATFASHVEALKGALSSGRESLFRSEYEENGVLAYPPLYERGICVEQDADIADRVETLRREGEMKKSSTTAAEDVKPMDELDDARGDRSVATYFYPLYIGNKFPNHMHPVFLYVLDMLCEYVNTPIATVLPFITNLDKQMRRRCQYFLHEDIRIAKAGQSAS
ncbi:TPA: hypothetical protein N0F65_006636 [Lagenidium giganteum]|uniref:GATA-type domain-containing protein n=1 Tax=Lagenidium giganteum TaxID=4803 RepID=A0AAV2Z662_9STRA|nr:TPA: hypothetical protein N0F65_006636 [Lagenidium giganteum]